MQEIKMKKSVTLFVCKSACVLLSIIALTGLVTPLSHASSSDRMRKTGTPNIIQISGEQEFAQAVQRAGIVVVLVYLPMCDACEQVLPQYENLANTSSGAPVTYLQADYNTVPDIAAQFGITSVPTFILYKDGVALQKVATTDITQLQNTIQQNL
jgi:thioredoxin-like negative regulator of GroEL